MEKVQIGRVVEFYSNSCLVEIKEFKIPKSMITLFLNNNPTKNGYKRFSIDVETIENEDNDEEVHPYEENEDYD